MNSDQACPAETVAVEPSPGDEILVSVIVLTYNHAATIESAVESVLHQNFGHPWEILVAEDCSTDSTRDGISRLCERFPGRLRVLARPQNLGLSRNLEDAFRRCRGKYISILEGDDRWISPRKLTRVVDALESHPEWSGCFHQCQVEYVDVPPGPLTSPHDFDQPELRLADLLDQNWIPTYSVMTYRRGLVESFPEWHRSLACGDWGLNCLHAACGPIGFVPEAFTGYRVHSRGMWGGKPTGDRIYEYLTFWSVIDAHFRGEYHDLINKSRSRFLDELNREYADLKRIERRYHLLGLDHVAAILKRAKQLFGGKPNG